MKLTAAAQQDIPRIMGLIGQAKAFLKSNGVNQWQEGYPDAACIEQDIENGTGLLCIHKGETVGYLCMDLNGEPAYDELAGHWLSSQPYAVVHRLALDSCIRGCGFSSRVFEMVEEFCREKSVHSIKIDTDEGNRIMKHLLEKNGFHFCGTVCFQNSEKLAYEKLV